MKVYLVGGAVRDEQLGLPVVERDWCVVGVTPEDMQDQGYKPIGKDFPVFLHPESKEEYALARTERKTGRGYHGFSFDTSPEVTIEQDLSRRDLTINAMAKDDEGRLIDPFDGAAHIRAKQLRHVSDAFSEDPVRILRTAKFAARFASLGFTVADETLELMRQMVAAGEADALVAERVWKETEEALAGPAPRVFFEVLRDCGALAAVYPEVDAMYGVPQPEKWHPEIDCGLHTMLVIEQAARLSDDVEVRFAALVHDLGKATTAEHHLPKHPGHERESVRLVRSIADRLPIPASCRELGALVAEFHGHCHRVFELRAATVLKVLERVDAFRRPDRFERFLLACEADARGRTGLEDRPYPQADYFREAYAQAAAVTVDDLDDGTREGATIGRELSRRREAAIEAVQAAQLPPK